MSREKDTQINGRTVLYISIDEPTYILLSLDEVGNRYLTGINVDYSSDNESVSQTVRVGTSSLAKYKTIQMVFDDEISHTKTPLIIKLEGGIYNEKITADEYNVTLQSLSGNPESAINQSDYYSFNIFNENG